MDAEQTQDVFAPAPETLEQPQTGIEVPAAKLDVEALGAGDLHITIQQSNSPVKVQENEELPLHNGQEALNLKETDNQEMEMDAEKSPKNSPEKVVESELTEAEKVLESPEADRSPVKTTDSSAECTIDNSQSLHLEQTPMPEKSHDEPLEESNIEMEKCEEPVPEVVAQPEQTIPEPVAQSHVEEVERLCTAKEVPEQPDEQPDIQMVMTAEPEMQSEPEIVTEAEAVKVEPESPEKILKEIEVEKPTEMEAAAAEKVEEAPKVDEIVTVKAVETVKEAAVEKPVESETVEEKPIESETVEEKPVQAETVKEVEGEKPVAVETVEVEAVEVPSTESEVEKAEQQEAEVQEPIPAPGSLSFALLEQEQTIATLRTSRTLIVLKGLPGSGKSLLAHAIADSYKELCTVFSADDHGVKPESPEASNDAYKALDEAVVAYCSAGTAASMAVVDDTNHTHARLVRLGELAEQHRLVALFLEPRTEWSRDLPQLAKRSRRGLEEAQLKVMKDPLEETTLPLYFGWFLLPGVQDKVRCMSMDFLKTLDTLEAFQKHLTDFTGEAGKEVDLEQYFQTKGVLHCTTKFCDYGKAKGAMEYALMPAVKELYGSAFELSLSALFVTPRTVGARVSLSEDQLVLWPVNEEKDAGSEIPSAASLPEGSRAHITLGCAEGVEPVQTGLDLLEILALQQDGQQGELVEEMELGSLAYYGKGRWLLSLREPVSAQACFSSCYRAKKEDQVKKESEKKKKSKCTIL